MFKALSKHVIPNTEGRGSSLRCNRTAAECIYNCHHSASQVILPCSYSAAWSESLEYLQYQSQRRDMNHTHHFRLCSPSSSLPDNTQPVRQISQHLFNSFFSYFKTFLMLLTLKGKFQAFIIWKYSHPSPGNWASDIRLVTKVFVSNIVFRTDQHPARAIRTTRNWKKNIRRKAFTTDLTHCL